MKYLSAVFAILMAATAHAQCPTCPQQARAFAAPVVQASSVVQSTHTAHWTHPGDIHSHLRNGHGFDARGLSVEQAKSEHDRLHNAQRASGASYSHSHTSQRIRTVTMQHAHRSGGLLGFGIFGRRR